MAKQVINIGTSANDGTGSTLRVGGDMINDNFTELYSQVTVGKKTYKALLSQSGTEAPKAEVLENTIGAVEWTRSITGAFHGTLTGAFTIDKVFISPNTLVTTDRANRVTFLTITSNANEITIDCKDGIDPSISSACDDFVEFNLSIEVYP
jgi:hypothetical protein